MQTEHTKYVRYVLMLFTVAPFHAQASSYLFVYLPFPDHHPLLKVFVCMQVLRAHSGPVAVWCRGLRLPRGSGPRVGVVRARYPLYLRFVRKEKRSATLLVRSGCTVLVLPVPARTLFARSGCYTRAVFSRAATGTTRPSACTTSSVSVLVTA